ncbi:MAG: class I SAM-dependent methyltransferase [Anaerolineae bacterium]
MDHFARIYHEEAANYEALVSREDYAQRLRPALTDIRDPHGLDVIDLGSGTGRLAVMLAPLVNTMAAFDLSPHMLAVARDRLRRSGLRNWITGVADHRALPVGDAVADLAVAGWSIVYTVVWYEQSWRRELGQALREMERVLRPGGTQIIIETLGTGETSPHPPDDLLLYLDYLEAEAGFQSTWIRTDYRFASLEEAQRLTGFFFGDAMIEKLIGEDPVILPECTGLWWRHRP